MDLLHTTSDAVYMQKLVHVPTTSTVNGQRWTVGTFQGGPTLLPSVWEKATHRFEVEPHLAHIIAKFPTRPRAQDWSDTPARTPHDILVRFPVEALIVDHSRDYNTVATVNNRPVWYDWLTTSPRDGRPTTLVQVWPEWAAGSDGGPLGASHRKFIERMGYDTHYALLDTVLYGSPVQQTRLVIVNFKTASSRRPAPWALDLPNALPPRPMSNCLRPFGAGKAVKTLPTDATTSAVHQHIPNSSRDPMPNAPGAWIETPAGFRRLHADELAKGLGVPSKWWPPETRHLTSHTLSTLLGSHGWEALGNSLLSTATVRNEEDAPVRPPPHTDTTVTKTTTTPEQQPNTDWAWTLPDLRPNHTWHKQRIRALKRAVKSYPEELQPEMLTNGREDLHRHRANYNSDSKGVYLQVLWWEFPPEHWEAIRTGCSMNFLHAPTVSIMPNSSMDQEQSAIATEFFDELVDIGALEMAPPNDPILGNAPLFCIPKTGQPGQWRVLANMKEGLQNDAIGNEPVYLPRVSTILPHLYSGGWSATVDASKFFYQFPTVVSERKYLGCIHPVTKKHYRYRGLPMGAGNSPAIAGRMGAAILRQLFERHPEIFQGEPRDNTWQATTGKEATQQHGHGRVMITPNDGLPAVLVWVHVDDFFLHGPTYTKTAAALSALFDLALAEGLLCNPAKTTPPTRYIKYCGFIYDTQNEPRLIIPPEKRSRARVQVHYTLRQSKGEFSRLALSVVNGILQSLVDATPARIGQTYLRPLHDLISEGNTVTDPRNRFYTMTTFTKDAIDGLRWWAAFLEQDNSRPVRPRRSGTIGCAWGDGSGTGTGGTTEILGADVPHTMRMWMGTWLHHVHTFSSNWRELKTLLLTLEQEVEALITTGTSRFADMTLLYFTDNMTTYHVTMSGSSKSPRLHELVKRIKVMELQLGCHLEVIHVPGTTMIRQGTDGISRGVWLSPIHAHQDSTSLMTDLFAPVRFNEQLIARVCVSDPDHASALENWTHMTWSQPWIAREQFNRLSVWTPPPEMASQTLSFVLQSWVERPYTTSALFFIPRILQREWRKLSRHLLELTPLLPTTNPTRQHPQAHLLPVTVLFLPKFVPSLSLPNCRMDGFTVPKHARWHRQQADVLRGLSSEPEP
jgi:hypothetical protein